MAPRGAVGRVLVAALLGAAAVLAAGCEVGLATYPDAYYYDYPPPDYVATAAPVYFEGHAAYWYHDHWYYRAGGRWESYRHEPRVLAEHRARYGPPMRRNYGLPPSPHGRGGGGRR